MTLFFTPVEVAPSPRHITLLALNMRFTRLERDKIRAEEITDPDVSDAMYLMRQARYIDLDNATTIGAVTLLEMKHIIDPGRAKAILSAEVKAAERAPE